MAEGPPVGGYDINGNCSDVVIYRNEGEEDEPGHWASIANPIIPLRRAFYLSASIHAATSRPAGAGQTVAPG